VKTDIIPAEHKTTFIQLQSHLGEETNISMLGADSMAHTHLPSHSDIHISCLTQERIQV